MHDFLAYIFAKANSPSLPPRSAVSAIAELLVTYFKLNFANYSDYSLLLEFFQTLQIFNYEEEEAGRRDPNKDLEMHESVCLELCRTITRIKDLKADQSVSLNVCCMLLGGLRIGPNVIKASALDSMLSSPKVKVKVVRWVILQTLMHI